MTLHVTQPRMTALILLPVFFGVAHAKQRAAIPPAPQDPARAPITQLQADALLQELRQIRMLLETRLPAPAPAVQPPAPAGAAGSEPGTAPTVPAAVAPPAPVPAAPAPPAAAPVNAAPAPAAPAPSAPPAAPSAGSASGAQALASMLSPSPSAGGPAPNPVAAKPRQRFRIGVMMPKLDETLNNSAGAAEMLRATLMQYLAGPVMDVQMISSMLPQQVQMEAVDKGCDFLLTSTLNSKKGAGILVDIRREDAVFLDSLLKAAPLASLTPIGGIGAAAGALAGAGGKKSGPSLMDASEIAKSLKAKDEVLLDYSLRDMHSGTLSSSNFSARTTKSGEDVITPLVERAAGAILNEITNRKPQ